jgi:hypothetical protein
VGDDLDRVPVPLVRQRRATPLIATQFDHRQVPASDS